MKEHGIKLHGVLQMNKREKMNVVFVGHVDHGKSTVVGRLLSDTGSLPEGKLQQVKDRCAREDKVFEYAFLLDALKDEQAQGITIDTARCFFKSKNRDYIIIDAPGHIEFLKNMISGAARAEAAILVIDANEGIKENSKRHGYLLAMLGIKQVTVCVNKMDLVGYKESVYDQIKKDYTAFLESIDVKPRSFIPISAINGENIASNSKEMSWYKGDCVLSALDKFDKEKLPVDKPFRMPVQDIYKFTGSGDSRRLVCGKVESGKIKVNDRVIFLPSNKCSTIKSIEEFNHEERSEISCGYSTGFTLTEQIYINRGEIMCKLDDHLPKVSSTFRANLFWMGKKNLELNKQYSLKLGTTKVPIKVEKIIDVLDASNLNKSKNKEVKRHEVAECIFSCSDAIAFDIYSDEASTGRFVIIDEYDISGGGIILECIDDNQSKIREQVYLREQKWDLGLVNKWDRASKYSQKPVLVLLTGDTGVDKKTTAKELEKSLFNQGRKSYFLGIGNLLRGVDADIEKNKRSEHIRRLAEVSHILMDSGLIVVATASDLTKDELKTIQEINGKDSILFVNIGSGIQDSKIIDLNINDDKDVESNVNKIINMMKFKNIIFNI